MDLCPKTQKSFLLFYIQHEGFVEGNYQVENKHQLTCAKACTRAARYDGWMLFKNISE
jgi:hypothetical protein